MDLSIRKIVEREWRIFLLFFLSGIILIEISVVLLFLVSIVGGPQEVFRWNSPLNVLMDIFRCGCILGLVIWGSYPVYLICRVIVLRIKLRKRRLDSFVGKADDE